jgi:hypothetical protein
MNFTATIPIEAPAHTPKPIGPLDNLSDTDCERIESAIQAMYSAGAYFSDEEHTAACRRSHIEANDEEIAFVAMWRRFYLWDKRIASAPWHCWPSLAPFPPAL